MSLIGSDWLISAINSVVKIVVKIAVRIAVKIVVMLVKIIANIVVRIVVKIVSTTGALAVTTVSRGISTPLHFSHPSTP